MTSRVDETINWSKIMVKIFGTRITCFVCTRIILSKPMIPPVDPSFSGKSVPNACDGLFSLEWELLFGAG